ncbi:protein NDUFAF4 homolog [Temnothorax curvispinosus]|uniref:Protein NDUFAF4 homolog n=1 Tax=Temnothorax curvispinosus TaxID=300111 RepID=A0A6J1PPT5_9HYME|nr:protein NDUFAF4 homolog [Temnothorax curvispinosus]XP_024871312.1 protein NDUFAF4 homolog [Temnothorax curvispinosus]
MGNFYSVFTRPIRTFNIANRAEKIISREKPIPAPQYAAADKQRKLTDEVNPHFLEEHYKKNIQLDQRLKDVFVTSKDPQEINEPKEETKESKPLPRNRYIGENKFMYEPYESTVIPEGKCSLKQALTFLLQHKQDPVTHNSENIASEYKIDKKVVDDILKYFKLYVTVAVGTNSPQPITDPIQEIIDHNRMEIEKSKKKKKKEDMKKEEET